MKKNRDGFRSMHLFFEGCILLLNLFVISATAQATSKQLVFGDVNVVVLTDVHSWIAGHAKHEPHLNVDYGHVLSFYEHLLSSKEEDVFFVMNGDFMDGTGLSTDPPTRLVPLLEKMPWDAVNIGNHELYKNSTVEYMTKQPGFIDHWKGRYLTSNVVHADTLVPLGNRYTVLQGKHSRVLMFGFLYNFTNNCPLVKVEPVQQVVHTEWFTKALKEEQFNAIMVLAHMDFVDPLVYVILDAIRSITGPNMPVQFITGHTHYREYAVLDGAATSFEAGRYLDTVGFVSFPTIDTVNSTTLTNKTDLFHHVFLDANVDVLGDVINMTNYTTSHGAALSRAIRETEQSMGILQVIGCSPRTYFLERGMDNPQSLWGLYIKEVIEAYYLQHNASRIYIQGVGALRYDLFVGEISWNDLVAVSPFNDTVYMVAQRIRGSDLLEALGTMPNQPDPNGFFKELPKYAVAGTIVSNKHYDVLTADFDVNALSQNISNVTGTKFDPIVQLNDQGIPIATTNLWTEFIQSNWNCHHYHSPDEDDTSYWREFMAVALVTMAAVLCWTSVCKRRRHKREGQIKNAVSAAERVNYNSVV